MSNIKTIAEVLQTGVPDVKITNSLKFSGSGDEVDGLFLRVDDTGNVYGYRAKDQDVIWEDQRTDNITITAERVIANVTPDQTLTTADGSFKFHCNLDNTSRFDAIVQLRVRNEGVEIALKEITLLGDITNQYIPFYGNLTTNIEAGSSISITVDADRDIQVRGDLTPTEFHLIKAEAAPVTAMNVAEEPIYLDVQSGKLPTFSDVAKAYKETYHVDELDYADFVNDTQLLAINSNDNTYYQIFIAVDEKVLFATPIEKLEQ